MRKGDNAASLFGGSPATTTAEMEELSPQGTMFGSVFGGPSGLTQSNPAFGVTGTNLVGSAPQVPSLFTQPTSSPVLHTVNQPTQVTHMIYLLTVTQLQPAQ